MKPFLLACLLTSLVAGVAQSQTTRSGRPVVVAGLDGATGILAGAMRSNCDARF